jgi:hypothetical protein
MDVAVDELAPAVADSDDRPVAERLVRDARGLEPGAMEESVQVAALEPLCAAPPSVPAVRGDVSHATLLE